MSDISYIIQRLDDLQGGEIMSVYILLKTYIDVEFPRNSKTSVLGVFKDKKHAINKKNEMIKNNINDFDFVQDKEDENLLICWSDIIKYEIKKEYVIQ